MLTYRTCPVCSDGTLAYYNGVPQTEAIITLDRFEGATEIIKNVSFEEGISIERILSPSDMGTEASRARKILSWRLRDRGLGLSDIARVINRSPSTVRYLVKDGKELCAAM